MFVTKTKVRNILIGKGFMFQVSRFLKTRLAEAAAMFFKSLLI